MLVFQVHLDEDGGEGGSNEVLSGNNTLPLYCCKTCNLACLSLPRFNTHTCRLPTDDENILSPVSSCRFLDFDWYAAQ